MKRVVTVVQVFAVVCTLGFVVMLFANEPDAGGAAAPTNDAPQTAKVSGADVYSNRCAGCHGGDGAGGLGPQLSDGKVKARFPDIAEQIAVITDGRGGMPAFGGKLTDEQIRAVAEYERSL
jgi:cytochrome c551